MNLLKKLLLEFSNHDKEDYAVIITKKGKKGQKFFSKAGLIKMFPSGGGFLGLEALAQELGLEPGATLLRDSDHIQILKKSDAAINFDFRKDKIIEKGKFVNTVYVVEYSTGEGNKVTLNVDDPGNKADPTADNIDGKKLFIAIQSFIKSLN